MVVLEALSQGCPVVCPDAGGLLEMVDVGDVAGLANRMVCVLNAENAEWRRMSEAAYARAIRFTWKDMAEVCERALQAAIERVW
jgi:glycosyltransferase involved in cell wall biosynthesis